MMMLIFKRSYDNFRIVKTSEDKSMITNL